MRDVAVLKINAHAIRVVQPCDAGEPQCRREKSRQHIAHAPSGGEPGFRGIGLAPLPVQEHHAPGLKTDFGNSIRQRRESLDNLAPDLAGKVFEEARPAETPGQSVEQVAEGQLSFRSAEERAENRQHGVARGQGAEEFAIELKDVCPFGFA